MIFECRLCVPLYYNYPLTACIWLAIYDLDVSRLFNQSLVRPVRVVDDVINQLWENKTHKIEV